MRQITSPFDTFRDRALTQLDHAANNFGDAAAFATPSPHAQALRALRKVLLAAKNVYIYGPGTYRTQLEGYVEDLCAAHAALEAQALGDYLEEADNDD